MEFFKKIGVPFGIFMFLMALSVGVAFADDANNYADVTSVSTGFFSSATTTSSMNTNVIGGDNVNVRDNSYTAAIAPGGFAFNSADAGIRTFGTQFPAATTEAGMYTDGLFAMACNKQNILEKNAISGYAFEALSASTQGDLYSSLYSTQKEKGNALCALNFGQWSMTDTSGWNNANANLKHEIDGTVKVGTILETINGYDGVYAGNNGRLKIDSDMKAVGGHFLWWDSSLNMQTSQVATVVAGHNADLKYDLDQFLKHV